MGRLKWSEILEEAASIVRSYNTQVTLRQLFYRLVAAQMLPNTQSAYKHLSAQTAEARREGSFPALMDATREISRARSFTSPAQAKKWLAKVYRRDRTDGQENAIYLGVEKQGLVALLESRYWDLGIPIVALKGYGSQTIMDDLALDVSNSTFGVKNAILLYAGDFDPSGEDIQRDLQKRCSFDEVRRVALTPEQVETHDLPENPGKSTDSRAAGFENRHGKLVQVEVDALPPDVLKDLFDAELATVWDTSQWEKVMRREMRERRLLLKE